MPVPLGNRPQHCLEVFPLEPLEKRGGIFGGFLPNAPRLAPAVSLGSREDFLPLRGGTYRSPGALGPFRAAYTELGHDLPREERSTGPSLLSHRMSDSGTGRSRSSRVTNDGGTGRSLPNQRMSLTPKRLVVSPTRFVVSRRASAARRSASPASEGLRRRDEALQRLPRGFGGFRDASPSRRRASASPEGLRRRGEALRRLPKRFVATAKRLSEARSGSGKRLAPPPTPPRLLGRSDRKSRSPSRFRSSGLRAEDRRR